MELIQIGTIETPFSQSEGTPIQSAASNASGIVHIFDQYADALEDLDAFERIWLLFWCHRAKPARMKVIPYMDDVPHGLFSTRSPSRPNPIGISCVKLEKIEGLNLHIYGVDMLNSTPLLDIKPYDPKMDAHQTSRNGWLDKVNQEKFAGTRADERFQQP